MTYREDERKKIIDKREDIFKDPGNGLFFGKERDFVLSDPIINLWEGIRFDAIEYFERNKIGWWQGKTEEPTGHLLSSQMACVNHLYIVRQRKDIATKILEALDSQICEACIVDDGYVEFEFVGEKQYLKEKAFTRGANCTSIDAVMMGLTKDGMKKMFFIEWKYTETYSTENKYIEARSKIYDALITEPDSPFINGIIPSDLYYEPFYQLMRQTLIADQCAKNADHGIASYMHIHIVPEKNYELKNNITSPNLQGTDIHDVWKNILKDSSKFKAMSPKELLEPIFSLKDTKSISKYLEKRYWG